MFVQTLSILDPCGCASALRRGNLKKMTFKINVLNEGWTYQRGKFPNRRSWSRTVLGDEPNSEEAFGTQDLVWLNAFYHWCLVISEVLGPKAAENQPMREKSTHTHIYIYAWRVNLSEGNFPMQRPGWTDLPWRQIHLKGHGSWSSNLWAGGARTSILIDEVRFIRCSVLTMICRHKLVSFN